MPATLTTLDVDALSPGAPKGTLELLKGPGAVVWRNAVRFDHSMVALAAAVESVYATFEDLVARYGTFGVGSHLPPEMRCQPTAAAIGLDSVASAESLLESLPGGIVALAAAFLGGEPAIDLDICWLRRQYPDDLRPQGQAPHSFHQDGAFGFDFAANQAGGNPVLPILTAWIPLCPAGRDAPGLELIPASPHRILGLPELDPAYLDSEWPSEARLRPLTEVGDAVLMAGHHLHRTHVARGMSRHRTCIELRFVRRDSAHPALRSHRLLLLRQ